MSEQISGLQSTSVPTPFEPFSALRPGEIFDIADTLVRVHYDSYLTATNLTRCVVQGCDDAVHAYNDFMVTINPKLNKALSDEERGTRLGAAVRTLNLIDGKSYDHSLSDKIAKITAYDFRPYDVRAEPRERLLPRLEEAWEKTENAFMNLDTTYKEWCGSAANPETVEEHCRIAFAEFLNAGRDLMKSAKDVMRQTGRPLELREQAERIAGIAPPHSSLIAGNNAG